VYSDGIVLIRHYVMIMHDARRITRTHVPWLHIIIISQ